jgi:hypothetical protein
MTKESAQPSFSEISFGISSNEARSGMRALAFCHLASIWLPSIGLVFQPGH